MQEAYYYWQVDYYLWSYLEEKRKNKQTKQPEKRREEDLRSFSLPIIDEEQSKTED